MAVRSLSSFRSWFSSSSTLSSAFSSRIPASSGSTVLLSYDVDEKTAKHTGVAIVRFNRPEKLNALTVQVGEDMAQIGRLLKKAPIDQLRCIVVAGDAHDHAFSAGGDLDWLGERTKDQPLSNRDQMLAFYDYFLSLRKVGVPVLSAINGHAIGAGACLAISCDMRPAIAPKAKIGFNFARVGLHPGLGATHFLPKAVGSHLANRLFLSAELFNAKKAVESGLVSQIADSPEQVVPLTLEVARKIAENSPIAIRSYIQTTRSREEGELQRALLDEANAQCICYAEKDLPEGLKTAKEHQLNPAFSWRV